MAAPAGTAAIPHGDMAEILPSLPLEIRCPPFPLRRYKGFWLPEAVLTELASIHARIQPRTSDIFLASFPKSGTTWLKALAFATANRARHRPSDVDHPLRHMNPHQCVKFMEMDLDLRRRDVSSLLEEFEALGSLPPRLLATHLPYCLLPESFTRESRLVYICRKVSSAYGVDARCFTLEEAFERFCDGRLYGGPHWKHVLQYWEESMRRPQHVMFLEYEKMVRDPGGGLKKLAEFMGCGFSSEEEKGGVVEAIVKLCSLRELKNQGVNKSGGNSNQAGGIKNEAFFRKGDIGDWRNHLTPAMANRLDKIVEDALQGSGFTFQEDISTTID
ncbi:hypothetical protein HU200_016695 [Digitaria exilis]|uniref:Sulfotransferase n=1 Tax=Digitaria exilis TaxID=1010633 RepID=A0A835F8C0_9POAL|nr:hypothetical protein HU200_016695 [Digitaria exilis]